MTQNAHARRLERRRAKHYPLMTLDELGAIDVRRMLNTRAAVFMWATCPRLDVALKLLDEWQLHYRARYPRLSTNYWPHTVGRTVRPQTSH